MTIPPSSSDTESVDRASIDSMLALLRSGLQIDRDNLDLELIEQPELFYHAASEYALAVSKRDALKEALKREAASLALDYRATLEEGGKKPTEATISSYVETDDSYKSLKKDFIDSNELVEVLSALKESYSQRAWMLRELCSLYVSGMLSQNSVRGNNANSVSEQGNTSRRSAIQSIRNANK